MKYPWLTAREIAGAAHGLLTNAFGSAQPFPIDLDALVYDYLCERESLSFNDERDLGVVDGEAVLGRMWPIAGKIEITAPLKQAPDLGRYRFTVAHEIGHWVLHRPLYLAQAATIDLFANADAEPQLTSLNRGVFPDGSRNRAAPEEWQANQFAIDLLIPPDALRAEFRQRCSEPVVALQSQTIFPRVTTRRELARHLARTTHGGTSLCEAFGLSAEAMAIALEQRGYVVEHAPLI